MSFKQKFLIPITAGLMTFTIVGCSPDTEDKRVENIEVIQEEQIDETQEKIKYTQEVTNTTYPLISTYNELNNLITDHNTTDPDWKNFYYKHIHMLESGYTKLLTLEVPEEYEEFHNQYLESIERTLTITDNIGDSVEIGESLAEDLILKFGESHVQFEEATEQTEEMQEFIETVFE